MSLNMNQMVDLVMANILPILIGLVGIFVAVKFIKGVLKLVILLVAAFIIVKGLGVF